MRNTTTLVTGLLALALLPIVLPSAAAAEIPDGDTHCEGDFNLFTGSGYCTGGPYVLWAYDLCPEELEDEIDGEIVCIHLDLTECTYDGPLALRCRLP